MPPPLFKIKSYEEQGSIRHTFPSSITNEFTGNSLALWFFYLFMAGSIVGIFELWGLSLLVTGLIYLITCIRYRALIPTLYLRGIMEYAVRMSYIPCFKPVEAASAAPGALINLPVVLVLGFMFVLPLRSREIAK